MKRQILIGIFLLTITGVSGQYFHESLDLQYNLRPSLNENQKFIGGVMMWSCLNYRNTKPNLFDNFLVSSRFRLREARQRLFRNAEMGLSLQVLLPGKYNKMTYSQQPPLNVRLYDGSGSTNAFIPGVQYVKT
ncbi:MAG: hypothetical protein FJY07_11500 [Bacteroidetes bacterium]|nr:hypothetical protein [Bacteroidota bacterium]